MTWINLSDRAPNKEECKKYESWFLVKHSHVLRPEISRYDAFDDEYAYDHGWKYPWDKAITHWMPLPDLP